MEAKMNFNKDTTSTDCQWGKSKMGHVVIIPVTQPVNHKGVTWTKKNSSLFCIFDCLFKSSIKTNEKNNLQK